MFRQKVKISSLFTDELFTAKVDIINISEDGKSRWHTRRILIEQSFNILCDILDYAIFVSTSIKSWV